VTLCSVRSSYRYGRAWRDRQQRTIRTIGFLSSVHTGCVALRCRVAPCAMLRNASHPVWRRCFEYLPRWPVSEAWLSVKTASLEKRRWQVERQACENHVDQLILRLTRHRCVTPTISSSSSSSSCVIIISVRCTTWRCRSRSTRDTSAECSGDTSVAATNCLIPQARSVLGFLDACSIHQPGTASTAVYSTDDTL